MTEHWTDLAPIPATLTSLQDLRAFQANLDAPGYLWDPGLISDEITDADNAGVLSRQLLFAGRMFYAGDATAEARDWFEQSYPGFKRARGRSPSRAVQAIASESPA